MLVTGRLRNAGGALLGGLFLLALLAVPVILLYGAAELSLWALEATPTAFEATCWATLLLLVPLAIIPRSRGLAAMGFGLVSFIFGAILWVWALAFTYDVWGLVAVILGLFLFGIGIVPIGFIAALVHGEWELLGFFVLLLALTYGCRILANWLAGKAQERAARLAEAASFKKPVVITRPIDPGDVIDQ
ncbi:hypothetical protein [Aurantiacibacter gilvus]|uniref:Uncharacterized protein n=1 Tax=Aurantiacibacter gilvus TaxID=3139141 RepID=A0ABU9IDM7_9SPHN